MNVVIIGAGGHGRVVLDVLRAVGKFHILGFIDADTGKSGGEVMGLPILGPIHLLQKLRKQDVRGAIVAIGDNRIRRTYADQVVESGLELISAIHPSAVISPTAKLGSNILVAPRGVHRTPAGAPRARRIKHIAGGGRRSPSRPPAPTGPAAAPA